MTCPDDLGLVEDGEHEAATSARGMGKPRRRLCPQTTIRRTPAAVFAAMMTRVPGAAMPASALECGPRPDGTASAPPGRVGYHRDDVVARGDGPLQQVPTDAASRRNDGQPHLLLRVVAEFLLAGLMSWSELVAHLAGPLWPPSACQGDWRGQCCRHGFA